MCNRSYPRARFDLPFGAHDPFTDPRANFMIAHSPDYTPSTDTAPLYVHDWADLLDQCRSSLARRRDAYPKMIERRLIPADVAERDIAAWELLVAEWHWICSGTGQPPAMTTIAERLTAIDLAMMRVRHELAKGNRAHELYRQAHLIQALHWHLVHHSHGEPRVYAAARLNHDIRADQGARYCDGCDRWFGGKLAFACSRGDCTRIQRNAA